MSKLASDIASCHKGLGAIPFLVDVVRSVRMLEVYCPNCEDDWEVEWDMEQDHSHCRCQEYKQLISVTIVEE